MCEWLLKLIEPEVFIQCLIFLGLIWYAWETLKLRQASQEQNEILQKPCLVLLVRRREDIEIGTDIIAGIPYPEERILDGEWSGTGHVALHNIGNGPAFNIRHETHKQEAPCGSSGRGYLPYILQGRKEPILQVPSNLIPDDEDKEVEFKVSYESRSGDRYLSTMYIGRGRISEPVVTKCQFP